MLRRALHVCCCVLSRPQPPDELQLEYFVPLESAQEALRAAHAVARRWGDGGGGSSPPNIVAADPEQRPLLLYSELRVVAADDQWLTQSSSTGSGDTLAMAFGMNKFSPAKVRQAAAEIEAALHPFNPKPHWGKLSNFTAQERIAKYGVGGQKFLALCEQHDPTGKFRNEAVAALFPAAARRSNQRDFLSGMGC